VPSVEELAAEVGVLRAQVRATQDTLAIYELKAHYGELVDQRYERGAVVDERRLGVLSTQIAGLFSQDAVWDAGPGLGAAVGRAAIAERMRRTTLTFSRHLFVKPRLRVEGDRAWGRWDILCPCKGTDGRSFWMCGYEDDEYAREDASTWVHRSMRLTTVFMATTDEGWDRILA